VCPKTLPVRPRLGGGAATADLVTDHQEGERESRSNQTVRLQGLRPDVPIQSVQYREGRNLDQALPAVGQLFGA
jgi:hypothetical protein